MQVLWTVESKTDSDCLQRDLGRLQAWESKWDMEFNPSKCQAIYVTASRAPLKTEYILHGQVLESATSATCWYLGGGYLQQHELELACDRNCSKWKQVLDLSKEISKLSLQKSRKRPTKPLYIPSWSMLQLWLLHAIIAMI